MCVKSGWRGEWLEVRTEEGLLPHLRQSIMMSCVGSKSSRVRKQRVLQKNVKATSIFLKLYL